MPPKPGQKSKKTNSAEIDPPDLNVTSIGSVYSIQEVKTEDNPLVPAWFTLVTQRQLEQAPARSISPLKPDGLLELWNSKGSPNMFNQVLRDIMIQHPAFASSPNTPLTLLGIRVTNRDD